MSKITHEFSNLENVVNSLLNQVVPPITVSEAVIDHDYTLLALKTYGEAAKELWSSSILGVKKMEINVVEPARNFAQNDLRAFKEARRVFEQTQKAFDGLHYRYAAQSRSKEASSLREDAFQLHEARRAYLKASMDLSGMAPLIRLALDKVLVKMFSDQWREMRNLKGNLNSPIRRWNNDMERVRSWSREMESGEGIFRKELLNARKQMEDATENRLRPSRELEDYTGNVPSMPILKSSTATDPLGEVAQTVAKAEKQGWLYLRTLSGKPTRTNWVRRWFFIRNSGIFGWLVQGSRSGGVEESDRIGVLLCSVRPAQSEERRFAFEVKTKDLSIMLQADSQAELVEWMNAFQTAKQKALEDPASTDVLGLEGASQDPAFAISSPPAPEFAASAADSGMNQFREDSSTVALERGSTLPVPGADNPLGGPSRSSTDFSGPRRSTAGDREGESGRDHAARIIQKLDLHRKSTGGPQLTSNMGAPSPASPPLAGGGIASLIAASHNVMPVGPGVLPQSPAFDMSQSNLGGASGLQDLPWSSLAPNTLANVPAPTNLSATAVVINGERGIGLGRTDATGGMSSGVMANIWGSSNWGYLNRLERDEAPRPVAPSPRLRSQTPSSPPKTTQSPSASPEGDPTTMRSTSPSSLHRKTASLPGNTLKIGGTGDSLAEYPKFFPVQLKTQDAQFRLLFPNVAPGEWATMIFRATWSLNEQQEFPGRVYVTARNIYFYSHHLGFVLTSSIRLDSIFEVTAAPGRDYDLLFLHMKSASQNTPTPRVTIKTFLEPLRLLQQRLEYLVQVCTSEQPPDVQTIVKSLIKLEQSAAVSSPTRDTFEDLTGTATSDEGPGGRNRLHRADGDLRAAVFFDNGGYGRPDDLKGASRIKLPRQPVLYVPNGMERTVFDKVFDISPKALFHVMFGDKSAIWQLLYHERQAQRQFSSYPACTGDRTDKPDEDIKQSSWTQAEQSPLRRDFEYWVEYLTSFRKARTARVVDYQMIDVLNDHLCYVVTDRKTPWHLPYGRAFSLLSKIVITHHAKSKCRLAVYTKVDWTVKKPWLQGVIAKQAHLDLRSEAQNLVELVTDQVKKLGAQSRTKKAIQIFGQVGVQAQALEFGGSNAPVTTGVRRPRRRRTVADLMFDSVRSSVKAALVWVAQLILALLRWVGRVCSANVVILFLLAASVMINLAVSSRGTVQWLSDRQASNYLGKLGIGSDNVMSKAIYLQDVHDGWAPKIGWPYESESACRKNFDSYLSRIDTIDPEMSASVYKSSPAPSASVGRLQRSRQRLGSQRHDLMIAMRVINSIELEMVQAEWESWLHDESAKCRRIETLIRAKRAGFSNDRGKGEGDGDGSNQRSFGPERLDWTKAQAWHQTYCGSCARELQWMDTGSTTPLG
ncbi:MAG: hypothetical protein Q9183_000174 [Haloplaca sp. 2 TL-2023]